MESPASDLPPKNLPLEILPLEITVEQVRIALQAESRPLLLDCRTPPEWELARIDGARLLPMQELTARLAELQPHCDRPLIVHCHHGGRSREVAEWLRQQGFSQVQSMAGGIDAWSVAVDPTVPRY